ncbi:MAG: helix-turn-helix transcriptional regulator [Lentisphaeraceae bacterium]|nr:helix-turn-helix transcriptional regulator [Lentisphaeraceae bacterium]
MKENISKLQNLVELIGQAVQLRQIDLLNCESTKITLNWIGLSPRLFICLKGQAQIEADGSSLSVHCKNLVLVSQVKQIKLKEMCDEAEVYEIVQEANSVWIRHYCGSTDIAANFIIPLNDKTFIQYQNIWQLLTVQQVPENCRQDYLSSLVKVLLCLYKQHLSEVDWNSRKTRLREKSKLFNQVQAYIARHLATELTASDLCRQFQLNVKSLTALFHYSQRCTFKQMLIQLRLNKARKILISEDINIPQVAELCGFNSDDHFIYSFRENFGIPPKKQTRLLLNDQAKTPEELQELHQLRYYHFIAEKLNKLTPRSVKILLDNPTVCYVINESSEERRLFYLNPESGKEIFLQDIQLHERCYYNVNVDDILVVRDQNGQLCSWFQIENELCQALIRQ